MKPRPLNLAAAVSLLLAIAILILWVRSHARHEEIVRKWHTSAAQHTCIVQSLYSSLDFGLTRMSDTSPPMAASYAYWDYTQLDAISPSPGHWFPFPPARFQHLSLPGYPYEVWELTIAYWLLLPPTLVLPAIALVRHRRRRRRERDNLCPTCGYDLRATPEKSGPLFDRCPECGAVPASSAVEGRAC